MANFLVMKNVEIGIKSLKLEKPSIWSAMYVISGLDPEVSDNVNDFINVYQYRNMIKTKMIVLKFENVLHFEKNQDNIELLKNNVKGYIKGCYPCYRIELDNTNIFYIKSIGKYQSLSDSFKTLPGFENILFDVFFTNLTEEAELNFYEDMDEESLRLIIEVGEEDTL